MTFRTILHGTCLVGGQHPAGSKLAAECPVLRRQRRSKARRQGWLTRKAQSAAQPQPDA